MSAYDLPKSAEIGGKVYAIRSDYRAAIDVMSVMSDLTLSEEDRVLIALQIFYVDYDRMPLYDYQEAINYVQWFINGGKDVKDTKPKPKLMDWQQDFQLITAPINKVLGYEVRAVEYLHWWTFLAAYQEIGECLFSQVVSIRRKRSKGQKLDKTEERFFKDNPELVLLKTQETETEKAIFDEWMSGRGGD